jgi:ubiquitin-conjugating enzyme (huntingtin interacting protein 2)
MSDARLRRVNKEIAGVHHHLSFSSRPTNRARPDCKNDKSSNINIDLIDNSPFHLRGSFDGPQDTPYEGGHFEVVRCTDHPRPVPMSA